MDGGVANALQLGHLGAVVEGFAFVFHKFKKGNHRWTQMDTDKEAGP